MTANTGTLSFILYGIFISITIIAMILVFYFIKKGSIETEKLDKMIDLFKYSVVSVAIATTTLIISDLFKEREQDVKELEYFDKYVQDVKKVDGIQERFQLSKYLSIVAPNGEMKKSWHQYYDSVKVEYSEYQKLKKEKKRLDSVIKPNQNQIFKLEQIEEKIIQQESPLVSYQKSPEKNKDIIKAKYEEEIGFEFLLNKDVVNAINAFTKSENSYNKYHQVYEISKYLRENKSNLMDPNSYLWKKVFKDMTKSYSYGMSNYFIEKFVENSK